MATLKLRWLRRAERSLAKAADHIAKENPAAAHRLIQRIRQAGAEIAAYPERGRAGRVPGTREFVVAGTAYIIPYRVRGDPVEILHVLHTARHWPDRL